MPAENAGPCAMELRASVFILSIFEQRPMQSSLRARSAAGSGTELVAAAAGARLQDLLAALALCILVRADQGEWQGHEDVLRPLMLVQKRAWPLRVADQTKAHAIGDQHHAGTAMATVRVEQGRDP